MAKINHTGANTLTVPAGEEWIVTSIGTNATAGTVTFGINGTDYAINVSAATIQKVEISLPAGDTITTDANTFASIDNTPYATNARRVIG